MQKEWKNKNFIFAIGFVLIVLLIFCFCFFQNKEKMKNSVTDTIDININTDDDEEKIDWTKYETYAYELTKSLTITKEGVYQLTGTIPDGGITIHTSGNVKLVLENVKITNQKGPAIYVEEAENVVIETTKESTNFLEDGSIYSGYDAEVNGTIFSHDDITFDGEGTLLIKANNEDGIVSKDDLKIKNGTYEITANGDGIRGKDSVYIQNGTFKIESSKDGIKATNDTNPEKGYVYIKNGDFVITSGLDGIQAETKLLIENGTFSIKTGGGSLLISTQENWGHWNMFDNKSNNNTKESAKGIKSQDHLVIENGTFTIDASDDAIHSNQYVGIKNGTFTILSGDDGIHADAELIIEEGTIRINKSYEGIEASKITINAGNIQVTSLDDGINVAGGNDSSSMNRPGANSFKDNASDNTLTINGGNIYVDASGDGLDANGSIYLNGGTVVIDGPENALNGALDYDKEFVIKGGTILAAGASGMAQGVSSNSSIYNVFIQFTKNYNKGDKITIVDESNKEIISYTASKSFSSLVIASPDLKKENAYTIKINDNDYETFVIASITTNIGSTKENGRNNEPPGRNKTGHR